MSSSSSSNGKKTKKKRKQKTTHRKTESAFKLFLEPSTSCKLELFFMLVLPFSTSSIFVCVCVCLFLVVGKVTLFLSHERTVDTSVKKGDSHEFEPQTKDYEQRKECVFCADKNEYLLRVVKDVRCSLLRSMYYIKIHTHLTLSLVFLSHFFCIYSNCAKLSFVFSYTSSGVAIASTFLTFPKVS